MNDEGSRVDFVAGLVFMVLGAYLLAGLLFALAFVYRGVARVDPNAVQGSWGFKLLIIPATAVLWPLLLRRWLQAAGQPPEECSPHICASRTQERP